MMRRGFALLAVLWVVAVLTAVIGASVRYLRTEQQAAASRLALTRGHWAAEACWALAQARWRSPAVTQRPVYLGGRVYCDWNVIDPAERINVNEVDAQQFTRLLAACGVASPETAVLTARILARRAERHFDEIEDVATLGVPPCAVNALDLAGGSVVSAAAPREVLLSVPGVNDEVVVLLAGRRSAGRPVASLAELIELLSPVTRAQLDDQRSELAARLAFTPRVLRLRLTGWIAGRRPRAELELWVAPEPERLAVLVRWVK